MWSRGQYFDQKNRRMVERIRDEGESASNIFEGVSVYIDGMTSVPYLTLRQMICDNGGRFDPIFAGSQTTHFVAENLSYVKRKELLSKRDLYVVNPNWITDCISAKKHLNEVSYSLLKSNNEIQLSFHSQKRSLEPSINSLPSYSPTEISVSSDIATTNSMMRSSDTSPPEDLNLSTDDEVTVDKNYLPEHVFERSRFHVMGALKRDLQQIVTEFYQAKGQPSPHTPGEQCIYAHIDMDCYFVQVALLSSPQYRDSSIAVSNSAGLHSEVSSCNYKARAFGVTKGMWMGKARELCPGLVVLPYDYDAIRRISKKVYEIVQRVTSIIQVGSCDELFCDLSSYFGDKSFETVCQQMKNTILDETHCTCSIGISHNLLMCRIATKQAKPDGIKYIPFSSIASTMASSNVSIIPGVGQSLQEKLCQSQIVMCRDILSANPMMLMNLVGPKTADMLLRYSRGDDDRMLCVIQIIQSIGVQDSYGVRCNNRKDVLIYITSLCKMLEKKMVNSDFSGYKLSLKLYRRIHDQITTKFMGHGPVELVKLFLWYFITYSVTHSNPGPISSFDQLLQIASMLYDSTGVNAMDVRGVGLVVRDLIPRENNTSIHRFFSVAVDPDQTSHHITRPQCSPVDVTPLSIAVDPDQTLHHITQLQRTPLDVTPLSSPLRFTKSSGRRRRHIIASSSTHTIKSLLIRSQNSRNTSTNHFRPMIVFPPMSQLDISALLSLPPALQHELIIQYRSSGCELTAELEAVFRQIEGKGEIVDETDDVIGVILCNELKVELRKFLENISDCICDVNCQLSIRSYVENYTPNKELIDVVTNMMERRCKVDVYGVKQVMGSIAIGVKGGGDEKWNEVISMIKSSINSIVADF